MKLHQFFVASLVLASGIFAVSPKATAQSATVTVPFTSVVPGSCTFSAPTGGVLGVSPNIIGSNIGGGAPGAVSLTCNTNANVTINPPVPVSDAATTLFNDPNTLCDYFVNGGPINIGSINNACIGGAPVTQSVSTGVITLLQVGLRLTNYTTPIPSGTYTFNEVLTASPF